MSRRQNRSSPRLHRQRPHVFRACGTVLLLVLFAGIGALWGNTLDNAVVANTPDVASAPAPQETAAAEEASAPLQASAAPGTASWGRVWFRSRARMSPHTAAARQRRTMAAVMGSPVPRSMSRTLRLRVSTWP